MNLEVRLRMEQYTPESNTCRVGGVGCGCGVPLPPAVHLLQLVAVALGTRPVGRSAEGSGRAAPARLRAVACRAPDAVAVVRWEATSDAAACHRSTARG